MTKSFQGKLFAIWSVGAGFSFPFLQFNNYMSVIRAMFDRVEQEHRTKLEQLQKMQEEQRYV